MPSINDRYIAEMEFRNKDFQRGVDESVKSINLLTASINGISEVGGSMASMTKGLGKMTFAGLENSVGAVISGISVMDRMISKVKNDLANTVVDGFTNMVKDFTINNWQSGMQKYESKMASVQTMMNSTGLSLSSINGYLDQLMWYADETSYGFTDMTSALSTMLAAGGDINKLIPMIMGMANATAYAGKGASEFSRVIYNLNQSYSGGYLNLMDWKSVALAGVNSKELMQTLIDTGVEMGKIQKGAVTTATFQTSLAKKWLTSEVMEVGFSKWADATLKAYDMVNDEGNKIETATDAYAELSKEMEGYAIKAAKAAQQAKTFGEAVDSAKEAVQTKFMTIFEMIFGDYGQSVQLWSQLANDLWSAFAQPFEDVQDIIGLAFQVPEWKEITKGLPDLQLFESTLAQIAIDSGAITTEMYENVGNFNELLAEGWLDTKTYYEGLGKYADAQQEAIDTLVSSWKPWQQNWLRGGKKISELADWQLKSVGVTREEAEKLYTDLDAINKKREEFYKTMTIEDLLSGDLSKEDFLVSVDEAYAQQEEYIASIIENMHSWQKDWLKGGKKIYELTDWQLKNLGMSREEAKALYDTLDEISDRKSWVDVESIEGVSDIFDDMKVERGYAKVKKIMSNFMQSIINARDGIGIIWDSVFPSTAQSKANGILNVLEWIKNTSSDISEYLSLTTGEGDDKKVKPEEEWNRLQKTLKSAAKILDIVKKTASSIGGSFGHLFEKFNWVPDMIGGWIDKLNEWVDVFHKFLDDSGFYQALETNVNAFIDDIYAKGEGLVNWIKGTGVYKSIASAINGFLSNPTGFFEDVKKNFNDIKQQAIDIWTFITGLFNKIFSTGETDGVTQVTQYFSSVGSDILTILTDLGNRIMGLDFIGIVQSAIAGINDLIGMIRDMISKLGASDWSLSGIGENLGQLWGGIIKGLGSLDMYNCITALESLFSLIIDFFVGDAIISAMRNFKMAISGFKDVVQEGAYFLKMSGFEKMAQGLWTAAKSILVVAGAIFLLSLIPTEKLMPTLLGFAAVIVALGVVYGIVMAVANGRRNKELTKAVNSLKDAFSNVILSIKDITKSISNSISKIGKAVAKSFVIVSFVAALGVILYAIIKIASMEDKSKIWEAAAIVGAVGVVLAICASALARAGTVKLKEGEKAQSVIGQMAILLGAIALITKMFSKMKPDEIDKGLGALTMLLAIISVVALIATYVIDGEKFSKFAEGVNKIGTSMVKVSASLLIGAFAMTLFTGAITALTVLPFGDLAKTLITVTIALWALGYGLYELASQTEYVDNYSKVANQFLKLGLAMILLAFAAQLLSLVGFKNIAAGFLTVVVVLTVMLAILAGFNSVVPDLKNMINAIAGIGYSILAIAAAFLIMNQIRPDRLSQVVTVMLGVILVFGLMALAAGALKKFIIAGAIAIGALAVSLAVVSVAALIFATAFGVAAIGIALLSNVLPIAGQAIVNFMQIVSQGEAYAKGFYNTMYLFGQGISNFALDVFASLMLLFVGTFFAGIGLISLGAGLVVVGVGLLVIVVAAMLAAVAINMIATAFQNVTKVLASGANTMQSIGAFLIAGLVAGLLIAITLLNPVIGAICAGIIGMFAIGLAINSPSKITEMFGQYLDEGLANGILGGEGGILGAIGTVTGDIGEGFDISSLGGMLGGDFASSFGDGALSGLGDFDLASMLSGEGGIDISSFLKGNTGGATVGSGETDANAYTDSLTNTMAGKTFNDSLPDGYFDSATESFVEAGNTMANAFSDTISGDESAIRNAGNAIGESATYGLNSANPYGNAKTIGINFDRGFIDGVNGIRSSVIYAVKVLGKDALQAFKDALAERSPSKATREMGNFFGEGFVLGIQDEETGILTSINSLGIQSVDALKTALQSIADGVYNDVDMNPVITPVIDMSDVNRKTRTLNAIFSRNAAVNAQASIAGEVSAEDNQNGNAGSTVQYIQNNYSPKALSRIEIYRQTRRQLLGVNGGIALV